MTMAHIILEPQPPKPRQVVLEHIRSWEMQEHQLHVVFKDGTERYYPTSSLQYVETEHAEHE